MTTPTNSTAHFVSEHAVGSPAWQTKYTAWHDAHLAQSGRDAARNLEEQQKADAKQQAKLTARLAKLDKGRDCHDSKLGLGETGRQGLIGGGRCGKKRSYKIGIN